VSAKERLTAVVSTMGEVILPKVVRQRRDWPARTRLMVEEVADGVLLRRAPLFECTQLSGAFAVLETYDRRRTLEEMDAAVAEEARRRDAGE
jgi:bifunctional DNA-binding transcriptional regulator/antitoxin component of YhaV-PrlF toxin-antitoxin module